MSKVRAIAVGFDGTVLRQIGDVFDCPKGTETDKDGNRVKNGKLVEVEAEWYVPVSDKEYKADAKEEAAVVKADAAADAREDRAAERDARTAARTHR